MSNKAGRPGPPTRWIPTPIAIPEPAPPRQIRRNGAGASDDDNGDEDEEQDSDEEEEEDEDEDEYGAELTPALDAAILRTLAKIRSGKGVYSGERVLEEELKEAEGKVREAGLKSSVGTMGKRGVDKKYTLADHHRAALLSGEDPSELADEEERQRQRNEQQRHQDLHSRPQDTGYSNINSDNGMIMHPSREPLTHVQSQAQLRSEAVSAFNALTGDDDDDDEGEEDGGGGGGKDKGEAMEVDDTGLLVKRVKAGDELHEDEEEYRKFLLDMGGGEEAVRKILGMGDQPVPRVAVDFDPDAEADEAAGMEVGEGLSKAERKRLKKEKEGKKKEKKEKQDDDFLMNYILNRGWIDRTTEHVPTYDEIVGKPKPDVEGDNSDEEDLGGDTAQAGPSHPWGTLEDEDDFDERAEEFETAYNFRFEEPGSSNIVSHPREIPSLVRRPDDTRATKRAAKAERKAAQMAQKEEGIKREKGSKRREMEKQMKALKKDLGIEGDEEEGIDWDELEKVLEGDFDEGEWERVVGKMLEGRRYEDDEAEEEQIEEDDEKPTWDDDLGEGYDEVDDEEVEEHMAFGGAAEVEADEDGPINMDADFIEDAPKKQRKEKGKKGKGKKRALEEVDEEDREAEEGVTAVERVKKVKKAMDEYKALDHEDMIGDLPTRFKYTTSKPTSFGLTPVEILLATDAELNAIVGIPHIAPYRKSGLGMAGKGLSKRVNELKGKLGKRKWGQEVTADGDEEEERVRDAGWGDKAQASSGPISSSVNKNGPNPGDANDGKRPGKRPGNKERKRQKAAQAQELGLTVAELDQRRAADGGSKANRFEAIAPVTSPSEHGGADTGASAEGQSEGAGGAADEGGKKKRRKKKHGQAWGDLIPASEAALQVFD